jgi:hypothetical protein
MRIPTTPISAGLFLTRISASASVTFSCIQSKSFLNTIFGSIEQMLDLNWKACARHSINEACQAQRWMISRKLTLSADA